MINDLFHLFTIEDDDDKVIIKSDKLRYSSVKDIALLNSWQKIDFILPISQSELTKSILVPGIYTELFFWYNEITNGDKASEFPELKCYLEYERINKTTIKQAFGIKLAEVNYSPGLRGDKLYDSSSTFMTELSFIQKG